MVIILPRPGPGKPQNRWPSNPQEMIMPSRIFTMRALASEFSRAAEQRRLERISRPQNHGVSLRTTFL